MTKDEVLEQLEDLFIVTRIGDAYFITEKYKTMFSEDKEETVVSPIKKKVEKSDWDIRVASSEGRSRAIAIMDLCDIPIYSLDKYRLRVLNKETIKAISKITRDKNVKPIIFIESIKRYYKHSKMPKNFKNLILDGDALDIYNEYIDDSVEAESLDPADRANMTWG